MSGHGRRRGYSEPLPRSIKSLEQSREGTTAICLRVPTLKQYLLQIPAELRTAIFEYALREDAPIRYNKNNFKHPALLHTCRQVRKEAGPIYYKQNTFVIEALQYDSTTFRIWVKQSKPFVKFGDKPNLLMNTGLGPPGWDHLMTWIKLFFEGKINYRMSLAIAAKNVTPAQKAVAGAFDLMASMCAITRDWGVVEKQLLIFKETTQDWIKWQ